MFLKGTGKGIRNRTHAAAGDTPRADRTVDITHDVMQQDVRGTRRVHTERRADDARGGHGSLDQVVFEVIVQKIGRAHREESQILVNLFFAELPELLREEQELPDIARAQAQRIGRRA